MTEEQIIRQLADHYREILRLVGEDVTREGLVKTPERAARALWFATSGYRTKAEEAVNGAMFTHDGSGMVIVRDIEYYSLCEHHILPFYGNISIGYIPDGKIIGLSKVARIVDIYARRMQVQERFTREVCLELQQLLGAKGVIVRSTGRHLCMLMRGVQKQDSATACVESCGVFDTNASLRQEFFAAIN